MKREKEMGRKNREGKKEEQKMEKEKSHQSMDDTKKQKNHNQYPAKQYIMKYVTEIDVWEILPQEMKVQSDLENKHVV